MAKLFPDTLPDDAPKSERRFFDACRTLGDTWYVFHSVAWQSKRSGRQGDGEADFVLMHPSRGLLVVEVKGGGVRVEDGKWSTVDRNGMRHKVKNPFEQATSSKHALLAYLRTLAPPIGACQIAHAVAFPDVTVDEGIGTYGPRAIVLDRVDLRFIGRALDRVTAHWTMRSALSDEEVARIRRLLAPTASFVRRLRDRVSDAREQITRLTEEQLRILGMLRRERRAVITGGAGTGKTVLAIERARSLSAEGFNTALLCYNAPLADWLARQTVGIGAQVGTFHALCIQQAIATGIRIPPTPVDEWWESQAPEGLVKSAIKTGLRFDAIVIDEAQDFAASWLEALEALLSERDDSPVYMFLDMHQELYARGFKMPNWPRHGLTLNCRNTLPIAKQVARIFDEAPPVLGATGPEPVFLSANLRREARVVVQRLVTRLIQDEALEASQIVVLSDDPTYLDALRSLLAANHSFCRLGGEGVIAESIARFKGLEADVIVLCLSDGLLRNSDAARVATYVGISRACASLFVVGSEQVRHHLGL